MSEPAFTPEQEARIKVLVGELLPVITQAVLMDILIGIRTTRANDGNSPPKEQLTQAQLDFMFKRRLRDPVL